MQLSTNTAKDISFTDAGALLKEAESILIITHYRPDGDAIGSSLALGASLKALGKSVTCVNRDEVPEYLGFMQDEGLSILSGVSPELSAVDLIVALDCATIERLGASVVAVLPDAPVLTIDHHITNEKYGDYLILDAQSAATGEILYSLIMENAFPLPDQSRDALYVAISTDTGSLQYSNSTAKTYRIMSELVAHGADVAELNAKAYFSHSVRRVEILRECLKNFKVACDGQVSYWVVSLDAQDAVGVQAGDMEGLMDLLRGIAGVRVCFTLEEGATGKMRLSMRSKDDSVDVSKICTYFGGGGHRMAAGAALDIPLEKSAEQVLAIVEKSL